VNDPASVLESAFSARDIGLFRIGGANPRQHYTWRATDGVTFHVPEAFGTLRLR
jgi:hypothetical protein